MSTSKQIYNNKQIYNKYFTVTWHKNYTSICILKKIIFNTVQSIRIFIVEIF